VGFLVVVEVEDFAVVVLLVVDAAVVLTADTGNEAIGPTSFGDAAISSSNFPENLVRRISAWAKRQLCLPAFC
jgi:hypothetical protein